MSRLRRFLLENHCYHVSTATAGRQPVFSNAAAAQVVVDALRFLRRERAYVLAYAVMPDHIHVLLVPRAPQTVSSLMQSLKGFTSRAINAQLGRHGALWQESFYDRVIRGDQHLMEAIEYVHGNPVAAGLAQRPEDYPFCSAHPQSQTDLEQFLGS